MAFHEIKRCGRGTPSKNQVRFLRHSTDRSGSIVISEDVWSALGRPDFVRVMVGSDKDAGKISISAGGKTKVYPSSRSSRQRRLCLPCASLGIRARTTGLDFKVNDKALIVDISPLQKPQLVAAE